MFRLYLSRAVKLTKEEFVDGIISGSRRAHACFSTTRGTPQRFVAFYTRDIMRHFNKEWNGAFPNLKVNLTLIPVMDGFKIQIVENSSVYLAVLEPDYHPELKKLKSYWTLPIIVHRLLSIDEYALRTIAYSDNLLTDVLRAGMSYNVHNICYENIVGGRVEKLYNFFTYLNDPDMAKHLDDSPGPWSPRQSELIRHGLRVFEEKNAV